MAKIKEIKLGYLFGTNNIPLMEKNNGIWKAYTNVVVEPQTTCPHMIVNMPNALAISI